MTKTMMLATAFAVCLTGAAYAHDVKDNPFRADNDNTAALNTDSDGQITANFTTVLPGGNLPLGMAPNADLAAK